MVRSFSGCERTLTPLCNGASAWAVHTVGLLLKRCVAPMLIFGLMPPSGRFCFFSSRRRRIPQLPPFLPVRLRNQWVRLQVEPDHVFHRPHVLRWPGDGPQEGVPRGDPGPGPAHRGREPPQWLSLLLGARRGNEEKQLRSLSTLSKFLMTKVNSVSALIVFFFCLCFLVGGGSKRLRLLLF